MTYAEAKARKAELEAEARDASAAIPRGARGPMGLTSAEDKTPEWRKARDAYDRAHARLGTFNRWFVATFKAEIRAERQGA